MIFCGQYDVFTTTMYSSIARLSQPLRIQKKKHEIVPRCKIIQNETLQVKKNSPEFSGKSFGNIEKILTNCEEMLTTNVQLGCVFFND